MCFDYLLTMVRQRRTRERYGTSSNKIHGFLTPLGLLITFVQFIVTFLFTLPTHISVSNPPWLLKTPSVPLVRWIPNILLFFTVNMLNNIAFGYDISVPVHIILRSGGSMTTMLVGFIWGKRFTRMQVFSVSMLTAGVIVAAMSDAQAKVTYPQRDMFNNDNS